MSALVITGDLHQRSLSSLHSAVLAPRGETELSVTARYLELCNEAGFVPTLFLSGKIVSEEAELLRDLLSRFRFEIGGHTWDCYRTGRLLYGLGRLAGQANGPRAFQAADIRKTLAALSDLEQPVVAWRNHAYRQDRHTNELLAAAGVEIVSNRVQSGAIPKTLATGAGPLFDVPINCLPDHENLRHGGGPLAIDAWAAQVRQEIVTNLRRGVPSILLAHPACMEIEDKMSAFSALLRRFKGTPTVTIGGLRDFVDAQGIAAIGR